MEQGQLHLHVGKYFSRIAQTITALYDYATTTTGVVPMAVALATIFSLVNVIKSQDDCGRA